MIRLYWATPSKITADGESMLSPAERRRMLRYRRQEDRDRFAVAWTMARRVLAELTDTEPDLLTFDRSCLLCGDPEHGKPRLSRGGPDFSLSHAADRVVLAVVDRGVVGVDVEHVGHDIDELAGMILHPEETVVDGQDLLRVWVRKEAVLKATGHGLTVPMTSLRLSDPPEAATVIDIAADEGYVAAVATITPPGSPPEELFDPER